MERENLNTNLMNNYASLAMSLGGKALASMCEDFRGVAASSHPSHCLRASVSRKLESLELDKNRQFSSAMCLCHHPQHATLKPRD